MAPRCPHAHASRVRRSVLPLIALAAFATARAADDAVLGCQQALERAGASLFARDLDALRTCTGAVFACVQTHPGQSICLSAASATCARELAPLTGTGPTSYHALFQAEVAAGCAGLSAAQLFEDDGLGHARASCSAFVSTEPRALPDLASCIARQHRCRAEQLVSAEVPRAAELLRLAGQGSGNFGCVEPGADGAGRGLGATGAGLVRARGHRLPFRSAAGPSSGAQALTGCGEALAWGGAWYVRDYEKALVQCLDGVQRCGSSTDRETCLATARATCALQVERIHGARGIDASYRSTIGVACGSPALDATQLLSALGLGFASRADACAALGVDSLATLADVANCSVLRHACGAQQVIARQVPRAAELIEAGGLDPAGFRCLAAESGVVCGNGRLDALEQCDPPGSFTGCDEGRMCGGDCRCVTSNPPVLHVEPTEVALDEGQAIAVGVTASDPDGEPVSITATPLVSGVTFTATNGIAATGTLDFAPSYAQSGPLAVRFTATDPNGLTDVKTVRFTVRHVNRVPQLSVVATAAVDEGRSLTIPVVASDPDGDPLAFTVEPQPLPPNAVFVPATGTLTFTPDFDQAGVYTFTFAASDGALQSAPASCVVTVADVTGDGSGATTALTLDVDRASTPTLLPRARITGRVGAVTGGGTLPPRVTSALVTGLDPAQAEQGASVTVQLTGTASGPFTTHFEDGVSSADFGPGMVVQSLAVSGPQSAVATVVIDAGATPGAHQLVVGTRNEVAVSMIGFTVLPGQAIVTGRVVDAGSKAALAGAFVGVAGTAFDTRTAADGTFRIASLPGGSQTLVLSATDHDPASVPVELRVGDTVDAGAIGLAGNVFDRTQPAGATLYSVIGRGLGDLTGRITVDDARKLVQDTLLWVGADELGVLDPYGNQLNPKVTGDGLVSLEDHGVTLIASRLAEGQSVRLLDVLYHLSFGYAWSGGAPPPVATWLAGLQRSVDRAWRNPNDAASAPIIAVFNQGRTLSPNAPRITGDLRLSPLQAHLLVNGIGTAFYRQFTAPAQTVAARGSKAVTDAPGLFTQSWTDLLSQFGPSVKGPDPRSVTGGTVLPGLETLLQQYYVDNSPAALEQVRALLLQAFPSLGLEQIFAANPYGVKEALDHVVRISASDIAIQQLLTPLLTNASGTPNLWSLVAVERGPAWDVNFHTELMEQYQLQPQILQNSWAPQAPYIVSARETTATIGATGSDVRIPSVRVSFWPSGSEGGGTTEGFVYRLWRYSGDRTADESAMNATNPAHGSLVLVASGAVDQPSGLAPKTDPDDARRRFFDVYLPPAGMNHYRIDVVKAASESLIEQVMNKPEYESLFRPWLRGYVDDPLVMSPFHSISNEAIHPGQVWLDGVGDFRISPLSNDAAVWVAGQGTGMQRFGRVDLAADYVDSRRVYVSIPGFEVDPNSGGVGVVFRYDAQTSAMTKHVEPGFKRPGQIGLALDENHNLYSENAASEEVYGGRLFRFLGWRDATAEEPFSPAFPVRASGESVPDKFFCGSINYYSRLIMRARPTALAQLVMGPATTTNLGEELYVADMLDRNIKRVPVHMIENLASPDPQDSLAWRSVGQPWAWNSTSPAAGVGIFGFDALTDACWNRDRSTLYVTQGTDVLEVKAGQDNVRSIERSGTIFSATAGCAVCEDRGEQYLFVSDRAPGATGRIYRIPLGDLPLQVPTTGAEQAALRDRYTFLYGVEAPGQIRITDDGSAMVYTDATGLRYRQFGFSGVALDSRGQPMVNAAVTVDTRDGTKSTVTDAEGRYHFSGITDQPVVYANVVSPAESHSERISLTGKCNGNTVPTACVSIVTPANGTFTTESTVTVGGTVFPSTVDYTNVRGTVEVKGPGGSRSYPLHYTGHRNDFLVAGVELFDGDNAIVVRVDAVTGIGASASLVSLVRKVSDPAPTQSAAGVVTDGAYNPRPLQVVAVKVDGTLARTTQTDACGYWSVSGLPLGVVTSEVAGDGRKSSIKPPAGTSTPRRAR